MIGPCYICGKPAIGSINVLGGAAGTRTTPDMQPVCNYHQFVKVTVYPPNAYQDLSDSWNAAYDKLRGEVERLQTYIRVLEKIIAMTDPCIHQELADARKADVEGSTMTLEEYIATRQLDVP